MDRKRKRNVDSMLPVDVWRLVVKCLDASSRQCLRQCCTCLRDVVDSVTEKLSGNIGFQSELKALTRLARKLPQLKEVALKKVDVRIYDVGLSLSRSRPGLKLSVWRTRTPDDGLLQLLNDGICTSAQNLDVKLQTRNNIQRQQLLGAIHRIEKLNLSMDGFDVDLLRRVLDRTSSVFVDCRGPPPAEWADLRPAGEVYVGIMSPYVPRVLEPFHGKLAGVILHICDLTLPEMEAVLGSQRPRFLSFGGECGNAYEAIRVLERHPPHELRLRGESASTAFVMSNLPQLVPDISICPQGERLCEEELYAVAHALSKGSGGTVQVIVRDEADDHNLCTCLKTVTAAVRSLDVFSILQLPETRKEIERFDLKRDSPQHGRYTQLQIN